jgi:phage tail-like protein
MITEVSLKQEQVLPVVSHTVDFLRRYPGETVTLFSRVNLIADLGSFRMRITLPDGVTYSDCRAVNQPQGTMPLFSYADGVTHLIWDVVRESGQPADYEYWVKAVVSPTTVDCSLDSKAVFTTEEAGDQSLYIEEIVRISVTAKGRYLKYLPSIYQEDELMGRFLMLFESFLAPIEMQIEKNANYYDPRLAPAEFLPWLASWTGIVLDSQLPEKTRRKLLNASPSLFRKRGTRQGLQDYLEIFTGGKAQIIEHFSENFYLGPSAFLGPGIAFGSGNVPNTFMVNLSIPPNPAAMSAEDLHKDKLLVERKVASIIESEKPAHTGYELHVEIDPNLKWQN